MSPLDVYIAAARPLEAPAPQPHAGHRWQRWLGILLLSAAVCGVAMLLWRKWIAPEYFPRNLGIVKEGVIYRSAQHSPRVLRSLCEQLKIKTILDLGGASGYDACTQAQRDVAADLHIERFEFLLPSDGTGDPDTYVQALRLMTDPKRQPVLVHCGSGAQRTSTATLLYRMVVEGKSAQEAYPESFAYAHKPDEWILLAWIADNIDHMRSAYSRPQLDTADTSGLPSDVNPHSRNR